MLFELVMSLKNMISNVGVYSIPPDVEIIIKVIGVPEKKRNIFTGDTNTMRNIKKNYLVNVTKRTIYRNNVSMRGISESQLIKYYVFNKKYSEIAKNFNSRPAAQGHLDRHIEAKKKKIWKDILHEGATDASNHYHILKAPAVTIDVPNGSITLKASDIVPEFYFSGSVAKYGVYVIVMGVAPGSSAPRANIPPPVIASIEKAALTLAASGIEHGDLHDGNIMVHKNSVKIIDFGMTAILPLRYREKAVEGITKAVNTLLQSHSWPEKNSNNIFYNKTNGIMRYMNSYHSGYSFYNPTGKMIRYVKTQASKDSLDEARYKLWHASVRLRRKRIRSPQSSPEEGEIRE